MSCSKRTSPSRWCCPIRPTPRSPIGDRHDHRRRPAAGSSGGGLRPGGGRVRCRGHLTLTLDRAPTEAVSVEVATAPSSASSPEDFTALQTQVHFDPGQLQATVRSRSAPTPWTRTMRPSLELSAAQGLGIADPSGTATITDDDASPGVTIDDVVVPEGDQGTSPATFTVSLDAPSGRTITVAYITQVGSATSPGDFAGHQDELSFAPGQTERTIEVGSTGTSCSKQTSPSRWCCRLRPTPRSPMRRGPPRSPTTTRCRLLRWSSPTRWRASPMPWPPSRSRWTEHRRRPSRSRSPPLRRARAGRRTSRPCRPRCTSIPDTQATVFVPLDPRPRRGR